MHFEPASGAEPAGSEAGRPARQPYDLITLTTDYGLRDGFVGACHGVIHERAPHVRIVDLSHFVGAGDVRRGAILLAQMLPSFPVGVHVGIVDPGVGTDREPVAVATVRGDVLVGPDNGLLVWAAEALGGAAAAVSTTEPRWHRHPVSRTFHGRDIFAPVSAHLASGAALRGLGPVVDPESLIRLPDPVVRSAGQGVETEVLAVDHFGNVQLAARPEDLATLGADPGAVVHVGAHRARRAQTFGDVPAGAVALIEDSAGHAAVVANGASAAEMLDLHPGDLVELR